MNILITGSSGDIGLGIASILRSVSWVQKIIGADIVPIIDAQGFFDYRLTLPRASDPKYFQELIRVSRLLEVDLIIPTSESELRLFSSFDKFPIELDGIKVVTANLKALKIGFDKLATANFLREENLPHPWTRAVSDGPPLSYPCILKSRYGAGSKEVFKVENSKLISAYGQLWPDSIWQEYVGSEQEEYTCGVYGDRLGDIRSIIFKRKLKSGFTGSGEVVDSEIISKLCSEVGRAIDLRGSINIQLRMECGIPKIFEINPRFSSTVVFRNLFGFQDVLWAILEAVDVDIAPYLAENMPVAGSRFIKIWVDKILAPESNGL